MLSLSRDLDRFLDLRGVGVAQLRSTPKNTIHHEATETRAVQEEPRLAAFTRRQARGLWGRDLHTRQL